MDNMALVKWEAIGGEIKGALTVLVLVSAAWLMMKIVKGDVGAIAKIVFGAILGLVVVAFFGKMADPGGPADLVGKFIG